MLLSSLPPFLFAPTLNQTINKHQKSSSPGMAAWQRSNSVMPGSCINQTVRTNKRSITFECKARKIGTHSTFALRLTPIARDREREREKCGLVITFPFAATIQTVMLVDTGRSWLAKVQFVQFNISIVFCTFYALQIHWKGNQALALYLLAKNRKVSVSWYLFTTFSKIVSSNWIQKRVIDINWLICHVICKSLFYFITIKYKTLGVLSETIGTCRGFVMASTR